MHLGQVVCLLLLSVLSPFYHHVEMAEGGSLRRPIISLYSAYLEHVAFSEKEQNTAVHGCNVRDGACLYLVPLM